MDTTQLIAGIIAVFLPPVATLLKNVNWPVWKKQALPLVLAMIVSFAVAAIKIDNYWAEFGQNVGVTVTLVFSTYTLIWEKMAWLPKIGWLDKVREGAFEHWLRNLKN